MPWTIRRIVFPALLSAAFLRAVLPLAAPGQRVQGEMTVEGGADGFPTVEIALAAPEDACLDWGVPGWGIAGPGWPLGPYWGSLPVWAHDTGAYAVADEEGGEDGGFPHGMAALPEHLPCGIGLAGAGWPETEGPVWIPFGAAAGDGTDIAGTDTAGTDRGHSVVGSVIAVGAVQATAFWPGWPGIAAGGVADRRLAGPAIGKAAEDEDDGTLPEGDLTLVATPTPKPGVIAAVMPEPGTVLVLGMAITALALFRRART